MGIRQSRRVDIFPNSTQCPPVGQYPTAEELNEALGSTAIALYCYAAFVVAVLALQYGFLIGHFNEKVPSVRKLSTFWICSVYLVIAAFATVTISLPMATSFVWYIYQIYVGTAMGHFVFLTMSWYGGETKMLERIGEGTKVSFRVRPCCCCLLCPKAAPFSKNKIRLLKTCVYQLPYMQGIGLFLMAVLEISGYLNVGNVTPTGPYLYLSVFLTLSFITGIWGLFMFMDITKRNQLLVDYNYRKKAALLKLMVVFCNIQGILLDILVNYDVIKCKAPYLSASANGSLIKAVLSLTEALVLGTLCYVLYITDQKYL